jgi:hypothetical protein
MKGMNNTMNSRATRSTGVTALVVLLSLVVAYGIDIAGLALQRYSSSTFHVLPSVAFRLALPSVTSLLLLALAWFLFRFSPSPHPTAFFYLGFGLLGVISFGSNFIPFPVALRSTIIGHFRAMFGQFGFDSTFFWVSSYLLVLGIVGAVLRRR